MGGGVEDCINRRDFVSWKLKWSFEKVLGTEMSFSLCRDG